MTHAAHASWQGRRVLVTGASGFIGGHLVERLITAGAHVRALVRYSSISPVERLSFLPPTIRDATEIVIGDLRDQESIAAAAAGIDTIFHLGALIAIPYSYYAPRSYVQTNVEGTLNVLLAARAAETARIVHLSTSEVYGSAQRIPMDETHALSPQSPYAATKVGADKLAESFHRSFGLPVVTCRPFNTYGPRQTPRAVIPTIIAQALAGDEVRVGSTTPTRDFNYVSDTVAGLLAIGATPRLEGEVINLGTGREVGVKTVIDMVGSLVGRNLRIVSEGQRVRPEHSEVDRLVCDSSKARRLTGWEPVVSFEQGLRLTLEWFRAARPLQVQRYEL